MNGTQFKLIHIRDILASVCTESIPIRAAALGIESFI